MRIYQSWRDYLAQCILVRDLPVLSGLVRRRLVGFHADFYVERSECDAEARRPRFRAVFSTALDAYARATHEGYPEAEAREITHTMASWDFIDHGWGELIEFPPGEAAAYYDRYSGFYDRHGCSPGSPFGEFAPDGLPTAPDTPDRLNGDYPLAEPGLADEVYVVADGLDARLPDGTAEKGAVDATER